MHNRHVSARTALPRIESLEGRVLLSTYFVSTGGNDANAGSTAAPFRTIQRAAAVAQPGDLVLIRAGVYRETVAPAHSGTQAAPITFAAYNGENVVVSGADPVSGWSDFSGPVYWAGAPWTLGAGADQVLVDGHTVSEARWPNTGPDVSHPALAYAQAASVSNGVATIYDANLTQPDGFWNGAYVHFTPGQGWVAQTGQVVAYTRGQLTFSYQDMGDSQRPAAGTPYFLFGKFQALDAPGEWYVDPTSGRLYLWTPQGDSPANHLVEMKHRQYAFDLRGDSDIHLNGINIVAATIATDAASVRTVIEHMHAMYVSHFTVQSWGWDLPSQYGIALNGAASLLADSTIGYSAGDGVLVAGGWSRVTNCLIHDADYNASDSGGIHITGPYVQVDHNTIYNTARDGIRQGGWGASILNNTIHDAMLQTTDGGGIYAVRSDGTGSQIAYNRIYHIHSGGYGAVGIYLDDDSSNYQVHHNVVWDVDHGMKLNNTSVGHQIYNNTLDASIFSVASNQAGTWAGTTFANNILFAPVQFGANVTSLTNIFAGTDPRVVNRWGADYELAAGSPAIGAGTRIGNETGDPTRGPDIGALRYGLSPFASGSAISEGSDAQLPEAYVSAALSPAPDPPTPSKPPPPVPPAAVASASIPAVPAPRHRQHHLAHPARPRHAIAAAANVQRMHHFAAPKPHNAQRIARQHQ